MRLYQLALALMHIICVQRMEYIEHDHYNPGVGVAKQRSLSRLDQEKLTENRATTKCKTIVSPKHYQWSYNSHALSQKYMVMNGHNITRLSGRKCCYSEENS